MHADEIRAWYHRSPSTPAILSSFVDYIDEDEEKALDEAESDEAVERAVAYLLT